MSTSFVQPSLPPRLDFGVRSLVEGLFFSLLLVTLAGPGWAWELPPEPQTLGRERSSEVSPGETLFSVARRERLAIEHVAEANGLPINLEPISRPKLRIPSYRILPKSRPQRGLVINLPERGFYLFRDEASPEFFPIAVGQPGRFATPTGSFKIIEKIVDPEWIAPEWAGLGENNIVPAGPNNPLGDRWIGLTSSGIGLHGTNDPASIGSATSHGCMRMYPELVREVFTKVEIGWPVRIEYQLSRVALLPEGILVVQFPDIYGQGTRGQGLYKQFRELDVAGFYRESFLQQAADGLPRTMVDFTGETADDRGGRHPLARVRGQAYIQDDTLRGLGVDRQIDLLLGQVTLQANDAEVTLSLHRQDEGEANPGQAFLSRGSLWVPARSALSQLGYDLIWDAPESKLTIQGAEKNRTEAPSTAPPKPRSVEIPDPY